MRARICRAVALALCVALIFTMQSCMRPTGDAVIVQTLAQPVASATPLPPLMQYQDLLERCEQAAQTQAMRDELETWEMQYGQASVPVRKALRMLGEPIPEGRRLSQGDVDEYLRARETGEQGLADPVTAFLRIAGLPDVYINDMPETVEFFLDEEGKQVVCIYRPSLIVEYEVGKNQSFRLLRVDGHDSAIGAIQGDVYEYCLSKATSPQAREKILGLSKRAKSWETTYWREPMMLAGLLPADQPRLTVADADRLLSEYPQVNTRVMLYAFSNIAGAPDRMTGMNFINWWYDLDDTGMDSIVIGFGPVRLVHSYADGTTTEAPIGNRTFPLPKTTVPVSADPTPAAS